MEIEMIIRSPIFFTLLFFVLILNISVPSQAQSDPDINNSKGESQQSPVSQTIPKPVEPEKINIPDLLANWRGVLLSSEQALARSGMKDNELAHQYKEISTIHLKALALEQQIAPLLNQTKERLDELGLAPQEGELAESDEINQKRKELEKEYSRNDGNLKASRLVAVRAKQIERQIIENRRQRFVTQISQPSSSVLNVKFWGIFWQGLDGYWHRISLLTADSLSVMKTKIENSSFLAFIVLGGGLLIAYITLFLRRLFCEFYDQKLSGAQMSPATFNGDRNEQKNEQHLDYHSRINLAGISFLMNGVVPGVAIFLVFLLFAFADIFTKRLENLTIEFALIVSSAIIAMALVYSYLNPNNPTRRLIALSQHTISRIIKITLFGIILIGAFRLINKISVIIVSPFEVSIGLSALFAVATFVATIMVFLTITSQPKSSPQVYEIAGDASGNLVRWGYLNPLIWLFCIAGIVSLVAGYIAFAEFLAWQILIAAVIFAILWLILELLDLHRETYLDIESGRWKNLSKATGFSRQMVLQTSVFGFGLAKLVAVIIALIIFLISWGYRTTDWARPISDAFFGFKIGGLSISLSAIVLAIGLFVAGYLITKTIQRWLHLQFLPTTKLNPGLRNSIATIFGYCGLVLASLLAVTAAGLDLSKVAIVAGALSVGIGFGLQSIVNNFVSGLILLAERPIKSGDWIITSGGEGTVKKTSVRSTEIETFDGATIIIPNSTLITDAVTNWTHHNQKGRIKFAIGVGYDSDPDQVRKILLECGRDHPRLLSDPAPDVYFVDFGADALIFEFRGYLSDINNSLSTKSDLRFSILAALRKAKVEIPYPQRDIHIKTSPVDLPDTIQSLKKSTVKTIRAKPRSGSKQG